MFEEDFFYAQNIDWKRKSYYLCLGSFSEIEYDNNSLNFQGL